MKSFGKIFIFLAGALLLLHTFLPHEHRAQLGEVKNYMVHESTTNLFDLLKQVIRMDQGEGHLEIYETSDVFEVYFEAALPDAPAFEIQPLLSEPIVQDKPQVLPDYQSRYFLSILRFRGPPQLI